MTKKFSKISIPEDEIIRCKETYIEHHPEDADIDLKASFIVNRALRYYCKHKCGEKIKIN